jgi:hypothetical protein
MLPYEFYKVMHLLGLIMTFTGLTVILVAQWSQPQGGQVPKKIRILGSVAHGLGLLIALTGGFGLAARLGIIREFPLWMYAKIGLWLIAGAMIILAKRKSQHGVYIYCAFVLIATLGAWIAVNKPF